eukprot:TRINITY_DN5757_c0_g2_i1.p1 TRINITY_DN5757_c0_g2~~TRINITY_DN5757_c0_g2_i1.p1  ORF type:complete len:976 (-),score=158.78 TRINITY_DN5757_c0_g2_i1:59-2986(-)
MAENAINLWKDIYWSEPKDQIDYNSYVGSFDVLTLSSSRPLVSTHQVAFKIWQLCFHRHKNKLNSLEYYLNTYNVNEIYLNDWQGMYDYFFGTNFFGNPSECLVNRLIGSVQTVYVRPKGIYNQGATCYMNSLLQTLFITPEFRKGVYSDDSEQDTIYKLKLLFAKLQASKFPTVSTKVLTDSFKWDSRQVSIQQDIFEFYQNFINYLSEQSSKINEVTEDVFKGTNVDVIRCKSCDYRNSIPSVFQDITISIWNSDVLNDSLDKYFEPETIPNFFCSKCGSDEATRQTMITKYPKVLVVRLDRLAYDVEQQKKIKITKYVSFPQRLSGLKLHNKENIPQEVGQHSYSLYSVVVHVGMSAESGHYYTCVKSKKHQKWLKLNDHNVEEIDERELKNVFGGDERPVMIEEIDGDKDEKKVDTELFDVEHRIPKGYLKELTACAYMLFYRRDDIDTYDSTNDHCSDIIVSSQRTIDRDKDKDKDKIVEEETEEVEYEEEDEEDDEEQKKEEEKNGREEEEESNKKKEDQKKVIIIDEETKDTNPNANANVNAKVVINLEDYDGSAYDDNSRPPTKTKTVKPLRASKKRSNSLKNNQNRKATDSNRGSTTKRINGQQQKKKEVPPVIPKKSLSPLVTFDSYAAYVHDEQIVYDSDGNIKYDFYDRKDDKFFIKVPKDLRSLVELEDTDNERLEAQGIVVVSSSYDDMMMDDQDSSKSTYHVPEVEMSESYENPTHNSTPVSNTIPSEMDIPTTKLKDNITLRIQYPFEVPEDMKIVHLKKEYCVTIKILTEKIHSNLTSHNIPLPALSKVRIRALIVDKFHNFNFDWFTFDDNLINENLCSLLPSILRNLPSPKYEKNTFHLRFEIGEPEKWTVYNDYSKILMYIFYKKNDCHIPLTILPIESTTLKPSQIRQAIYNQVDTIDSIKVDLHRLQIEPFDERMNITLHSNQNIMKILDGETFNLDEQYHLGEVIIELPINV